MQRHPKTQRHYSKSILNLLKRILLFDFSYKSPLKHVDNLSLSLNKCLYLKKTKQINPDFEILEQLLVITIFTLISRRELARSGTASLLWRTFMSALCFGTSHER